MSEYAKGPRNTVKRYRPRANYEYAQIHGLINSTPVVHVSFSPSADDPFPAILPMIGQMGSYDAPDAPLSEALDLYLHGYVSSRVMNLARTSSDGTGDDDSGLPVCIAATKVDGLVLSLTPNSHSYNYRSAVLHGYATVVEDVDEKLWAMQLVTDSVVPERWANTRTPPTKTEMTTTTLLRVRIADASAKIRAGGVSDDRNDLKDEEMRARVWTGVVPVYETYGEPVPSKENRMAKVPEYIKGKVKGVNEGNKEYAVKTAQLA